MRLFKKSSQTFWVRDDDGADNRSDDLKLKPVYGVKFKIKTIESTAVDTAETICYAKKEKELNNLKYYVLLLTMVC